MAKPRRMFQIGEKIRQVIAAEMIDMGDPRFELITITSVAVTVDLRLAKVYWVVSGKERREEAEAAFEEIGPLFKRRLARSLGTKFVPHIKFYYDDSLDMRDEVDRLLAKARGETR